MLIYEVYGVSLLMSNVLFYLKVDYVLYLLISEDVVLSVFNYESKLKLKDAPLYVVIYEVYGLSLLMSNARSCPKVYYFLYLQISVFNAKILIYESNLKTKEDTLFVVIYEVYGVSLLMSNVAQGYTHNTISTLENQIWKDIHKKYSCYFKSN